MRWEFRVELVMEMYVNVKEIICVFLIKKANVAAVSTKLSSGTLLVNLT